MADNAAEADEAEAAAAEADTSAASHFERESVRAAVAAAAAMVETATEGSDTAVRDTTALISSGDGGVGDGAVGWTAAAGEVRVAASEAMAEEEEGGAAAAAAAAAAGRKRPRDDDAAAADEEDSEGGGGGAPGSSTAEGEDKTTSGSGGGPVKIRRTRDSWEQAGDDSTSNALGIGSSTASSHGQSCSSRSSVAVNDAAAGMTAQTRSEGSAEAPANDISSGSGEQENATTGQSCAST